MIWFALILSFGVLAALLVFVTYNLLLRIEKLESITSELNYDADYEDVTEIIENLNSEDD